jgi:hypothetical protein
MGVAIASIVNRAHFRLKHIVHLFGVAPMTGSFCGTPVTHDCHDRQPESDEKERSHTKGDYTMMFDEDEQGREHKQDAEPVDVEFLILLFHGVAPRLE